jgi:hypothetical protein
MADVTDANSMSDTSWVTWYLGKLNPVQYLELYPDLKSCNLDPQEHYETAGKLENRLPNLSLFFNKYPTFSPSEYLRANSDLNHLSEIESIAHFWAHGHREKRAFQKRYSHTCEYKSCDSFTKLGFSSVWISDSLRQFSDRFHKIYGLSINDRPKDRVELDKHKIRYIKRYRYTKTSPIRPPDIVEFIGNNSNSISNSNSNSNNSTLVNHNPYILLPNKLKIWRDSLKSSNRTEQKDQTSKQGTIGSEQKRSLIFGLYDKYDYLLLALLLSTTGCFSEHNRIGIIWGGTDLNKLAVDQDCLSFLLDYDDQIEHYAISRNIHSRLRSFNIHSQYTPIKLHSTEYFQSFVQNGSSSNNKVRAIYIYNGLSPGQESKYGESIYQYVIEKLPLEHQIVLFSNQLGVEHEEMPMVYLNCAVILRLTEWDGNANTVQEAHSMHIPVFSNHDDSRKALPWSTQEKLLKDIMTILEPPIINTSLLALSGWTSNASFNVNTTLTYLTIALTLLHPTFAAKYTEQIEKELTLDELQKLPRLWTSEDESREDAKTLFFDSVIDRVELEEHQRKINHYISFDHIDKLDETDIDVIQSNLYSYLESLQEVKNVLFICGDYPGYGGAATNCHKIADFFRHNNFNVKELYYLHKDKIDKLKVIKQAFRKDKIIITTKKGLRQTLKGLGFEPDLIILRNCLSIDLLALLKDRFHMPVGDEVTVLDKTAKKRVPIHYMVAGLFMNNLDRAFKQAANDTKYLNKSVAETAHFADKVWLNSKHTLDLLTFLHPSLKEKSQLLYFTFFPHLTRLNTFIEDSQKYNEKKDSEKEYNFAVVISDFNRKIKNPTGSKVKKLS